MKKIVLSLFCILLVTSVVLAQDTVTVAPGDGTLNLAVAADTVGGAASFPANRVYKLQRGGTYLINGAITTNNFTLRLVGEGPVATNDPGPAFIQAKNRTGSGPDNLINAYGDLLLKNVWVTSWAEGNSSQWQNISLNKPMSNLDIEGCVFDYSNGVTIIMQGGHFNRYTTRNTIYRNQFSPTQWWCGRSIYFNSSAVDTVIQENCTFMNQGFQFQEQDYGNKYYVLNHCTVVNIAKFAQLNTQWHEAYFTNNIFLNSHFSGERLKQDVPGQDPDGYLYGSTVNIDTLRVGTPPVTVSPTDPAELARKVIWGWNANYREPAYQTFYDTFNATVAAGSAHDSSIILAEPIVNARTKAMFAWHPHFVWGKTWDSTNPGFVTAPKNTDSIVAFLNAQFGATGVPVDWGWDGGSTATGDYQHETFPWAPTKAGFYKFPENLSYTNATLLTGGRGGYPVGDLNWFPTQKAAWVAAGGSAADVVTAVAEQPQAGVANAYRLGANYPNPFNPSTTISYTVPQAGTVELAVFNVLGQKVTTLISGGVAAGTHEVKWDGKDSKGISVGSGVYFYRLAAGSGFVDIKKMVLMK